MVKNTSANAEDLRDASSIPGLGRSTGVRNGNPLQDSCLENSMDREAWCATVHGVTKSWNIDCTTNTFTFFVVGYVTNPKEYTNNRTKSEFNKFLYREPI